MPTTFINSVAIQLPVKFAEGDIATDVAVELLNLIQQKRIKSRLRYLLAKGDILPVELAAKALELSKLELVPYLTTDDDDEGNDPIIAEAMSMARELIISRMAQEGFPPPKGIDIHAKALVDGRPDIIELARQRVEARYQAINSAINSAEAAQ